MSLLKMELYFKIKFYSEDILNLMKLLFVIYVW